MGFSVPNPLHALGALAPAGKWLAGEGQAAAAEVGHLGQDVYHQTTHALDEWLQVGKASGRGLKLDIKDRTALPQIIDAVKRAGVPEERLMLNGRVGKQPTGLAAAFESAFNNDTFKAEDYLRLRQAFPKA